MHEPFDQALVQHVAEPVFDQPCSLLPRPRIRNPSALMAEVDPRPHRREPREQVFDVAVVALEPPYLPFEVARLDLTVLGELQEQRLCALGRMLGNELLVVRNTAQVPQELDAIRCARTLAKFTHLVAAAQRR